MDKNESTVRIMLTAIEAPPDDVGVLSERGCFLDSTASRPRLSSTDFLPCGRKYLTLWQSRPIMLV